MGVGVGVGLGGGVEEVVGGGGGEEVEVTLVEDGVTEEDRLVDVEARVLEGVVELVDALIDGVGADELVKLISDATLMIGTEAEGVGETDSGLITKK